MNILYCGDKPMQKGILLSSMSLIKNVLLYLPQLYNTKLTSSLHSHIIYICTCQSHDNLLNYTGKISERKIE